MSRRRPTEADAAVAQDTLPPPASADISNAKRRTPTERAARFFRTRPVSSVLLVLVFCAAAMLTFSVGRSVGLAILGIVRGSQPITTLNDTALHDEFEHARIEDHVAPGDDHVEAEGGAGKDDAPDAKVGEDEKGALVDGVDDTQGIPRVAQDAPHPQDESRTAERSKICYRKYEPGKLGSGKMLCVTDEFFFDISIGAEAVGTIKIGVFGDVVPKSAANFRALATCSGAFADDSLCYKGDSFHRVVTNFVAQGGSKATGRSIYGPTFKEEKSKEHHSFLQHGEKGVVSWAEYPIGSQFFILIRDEATYLDVNHVVFGFVTEGLDILDKIHDAPRTGEQPTNRVTITNCGDARKQ